MSEALSVAFVKLVDWATTKGAQSIKDLPGCWEHDIDAHWWVAINGKGQSTDCSRQVAVPAYHAYLEFNGFPAGLIAPNGGVLADGSVANEEALLAALAEAMTP